ncbi:unnamed protein product [Microthlaspi erraticum]|uniref:Uncharacterized protein n=1 Tax=Microthlaspi erraticum TaxID=1685480 RepID=A0A6D2JRK3_9BRAS|nr:unnamed protein product [Microthlaspi erraticum]
MGVEQESIKPTSRPLTGFTAEYTYSCGTVRLPVYVGGISKLLKFIVMDKPAIYNAILGTPWLHEMKAVVSTFHQCVKFPTLSGNLHLAWGSKSDAIMLPSRAQAPHRIILYDSRTLKPTTSRRI